MKRKESRSGFEPRPLYLPAQRLTARPNRLPNLCASVYSLLGSGLKGVEIEMDTVGSGQLEWGDVKGMYKRFERLKALYTLLKKSMDA